MDSFIETLKDRQKLEEFRKTAPKKPSQEKLKQAFLTSIEKNTKDLKKAAVLFSGGVDSCLIARAVSQNIDKTILYCAGLKNSQDIKSATEAAEELKLPLVKIIAAEQEIPYYLSGAREASKKFDSFQLEIATPEFIALEKIHENNTEVFFSGQGSDEIFCGYSKYKQVLEEKGYPGVEKEIWKKLEMLWMHDLLREKALADYFGLEQRLPFLDKEFVMAALAIPTKEKILSPQDELRKHPVRKLAKDFGLSPLIYERKKKAVQYGSGIGKEVRKILKSRP